MNAPEYGRERTTVEQLRRMNALLHSEPSVVVNLPLMATPPPDWHGEQVPCQDDPNAWFENDRDSVRAAKKACARCPRELDCREDALTLGPSAGVWGGLTIGELKVLRVRRGLTLPTTHPGPRGCGHDPAQFRIEPSGKRKCRACEARYQRERQERKRVEQQERRERQRGDAA